jgi:hypothetical protein
LPEILQYSEQLDKQAREIKSEVMKLCWYMRGLSFTEGMHFSYEERQIIGELISENLETTKKTGLNFF